MAAGLDGCARQGDLNDCAAYVLKSMPGGTEGERRITPALFNLRRGAGGWKEASEGQDKGQAIIFSVVEGAESG